MENNIQPTENKDFLLLEAHEQNKILFNVLSSLGIFSNIQAISGFKLTCEIGQHPKVEIDYLCTKAN